MSRRSDRPATVAGRRAEARAEKLRAKEASEARLRKDRTTAARNERGAIAACASSSCPGIVVDIRLLEPGTASRGAIYVVSVHTDDHRTLAFTTADRMSIGNRVRVVGGRLLRIGG